jgi:hypothetical protein
MDDRPINELTTDRSVRAFILVVLALLAAFLAITVSQKVVTFGKVAGQQNTITVTGMGKAAAAPTIASINFSVQETGKTVSAAQDAATKRADGALAAVKKLGIDDKDVSTSGYSVNPQYEIKPCLPNTVCNQSSTINGYQVSESITVKVRDTAKAGDVLQALGTVGVQNIYGPNFQVDDTSAVEADARGKAIADAKQKAELLAKQLGVHLGSVVSFSESNGSGPMPYFSKAAAADGMGVASAAPTLPTGQNETDVSVSVTYEIR